MRSAAKAGRRVLMTPLHELLINAIEIAKRREPDLSDAEIARRAGLRTTTLWRAKQRCGPATLEAVFDALNLDLSIVDGPPPKTPARAK